MTTEQRVEEIKAKRGGISDNFTGIHNDDFDFLIELIGKQKALIDRWNKTAFIESKCFCAGPAGTQCTCGNG